MRNISVDHYNKPATIPDVKDVGLFITAFSDASFNCNNNSFGVGIWIKSDWFTFKHGFSGFTKGSSTAEKLGLEFIVDWLSKREDIEDKVIIIQCDNVGVLNKLNINPLIAKKVKHVKLKHVKGHSVHSTTRTAVNEWCDRRAKEEHYKLETNLKEQQT